ncbi:MAG: alpha/beta-type small acid-soluble spore protein [Thermaerobacterales bacterium]
MARGQRTRTLIPGAWEALERLKFEVAAQVGIPNYHGYLGDVPSRINGTVGGNMVRRMIALAEQQLAGGAATPNIGIQQQIGPQGVQQFQQPGTFGGAVGYGAPGSVGFQQSHPVGGTFPIHLAASGLAQQQAGLGGIPQPGQRF